MSQSKGFIKPTCIKIWRSRKEAYIGYLDGTISVYCLIKNLEKIHFIGSFRMHSDSIHKLYVMESLGFLVSSGYDSSMKIWRPPGEWEKKILVTQSMIEGADPIENLSMIREDDNESADPESLIVKHKITLFTAGPDDKVVESLLNHI